MLDDGQALKTILVLTLATTGEWHDPCELPRNVQLYEKQNRVRFPSGATRAEGILHLVHSDVFGHVSVPSLGKYV
jgi:hypothetical protein